jgi:CheY-like chemotaxis protein
VGKGSTFKIYLPRVEEIEETEAASTTNQPELTAGHENILIVEDEDQVRDLAKQILEEKGYSVMTAADGAEGVRICQDFPERFDLVITDVVMPMIGGTELAQQISKIQSRAKILYMSGYTSDSMVRDGVLEDEAFFLQKPFTPPFLADKVREVLDAR